MTASAYRADGRAVYLRAGGLDHVVAIVPHSLPDPAAMATRIAALLTIEDAAATAAEAVHEAVAQLLRAPALEAAADPGAPDGH